MDKCLGSFKMDDTVNTLIIIYVTLIVIVGLAGLQRIKKRKQE
jgi:hypothetical protein